MQIQLHDIRLAYNDQGQGQPLLFIHGYPLNRRMWQPQISGLEKDARALALDLRGHGIRKPRPGRIP